MARTDSVATPLFIAAQEGHVDVARLLLEAGVDYEKARTDTGTTPLFMAAQKGHLLKLYACCLRLERTMTKPQMPLE